MTHFGTETLQPSNFPAILIPNSKEDDNCSGPRLITSWPKYAPLCFLSLSFKFIRAPIFYARTSTVEKTKMKKKDRGFYFYLQQAWRPGSVELRENGRISHTYLWICTGICM